MFYETFFIIFFKSCSYSVIDSMSMCSFAACACPIFAVPKTTVSMPESAKNPASVAILLAAFFVLVIFAMVFAIMLFVHGVKAHIFSAISVFIVADLYFCSCFFRLRCFCMRMSVIFQEEIKCLLFHQSYFIFGVRPHICQFYL